jgi:Icc-related predicted phosphoesterase
MRLHLLSDLHLEFGEFTPPETDADVVLLPGDIHLGVKGVEWAKAVFKKPVLYVPGNHEFYRGHLNKLGVELAAAAQDSNVHVLRDQAVVIDGVRFVGGTLWTDFNYHGQQSFDAYEAKKRLEDFRLIRIDGHYRKLQPRDVMLKHAVTRQFIEDTLRQPFSGKTVVLSHHAPSSLSVADEFSDDALSSAYASRLDGLFGPAVALWVHGHMHHSVDYERSGTRVVCNPRGYAPKELNLTFNPGLVLSL